MWIGTGKSVQQGIAIGRLRVIGAVEREISNRRVEDPEAELVRFETARREAVRQQEEFYERALTEAGEEAAQIFRIHGMMLEDDDFLDAVREAVRIQCRNAEYAVMAAGEELAGLFTAMEDPYMQARAVDVRDAARAVADVLRGVEAISLRETEPVILAAEDLAPSETVRLDRSLLLGLVTREGTANSHTAILARCMGLPALIQCRELTEDWDGKPAVLDGYSGCIYVDPEPVLLEEMKKRQEEERLQCALLEELRGKPSVTRDGKQLQLCANISSPADIGEVLRSDAEGVGLFRSEFLYLDNPAPPTEEEQFAAYRQVLEALAPRKVIIRTCDLGADKTASYLPQAREENPALGLRGVRFSLTRRDLFKTQLRAMLRASRYGSLAIMFPMIVRVEELRACKALLEECRAELEAEGTAVTWPELGTMVETPAAVLCADELAEECSFFSIGTNDLTQYICALDRGNAELEQFSDPHHPAVLRAIRMTVEAGHRHGCRVGICGELGADPALTETFLRMGVDALSVNPKRVLPLRKAIRELELSDTEMCSVPI